MMNNYGYVGFYNGQRVEVYATDIYGARNQVIFHFRVPKKKEGLVAVVLAERPEGTAVPVSPSEV